MHKTILVLCLLINSIQSDAFASGQDSSQPRFRIALYTMDQNKINGLLLYVTDSSVMLYPGTRKNWHNHELYRALSINYEKIDRIELKKSFSVFKGLGIGAAIGIAPLLLGIAVGQGEAGAYASLVTFPVGIAIGTIVGATKKKKFRIAGKLENFNRFRKRDLVKNPSPQN